MPLISGRRSAISERKGQKNCYNTTSCCGLLTGNHNHKKGQDRESWMSEQTKPFHAADFLLAIRDQWKKGQKNYYKITSWCFHVHHDRKQAPTAPWSSTWVSKAAPEHVWVWILDRMIVSDLSNILHRCVNTMFWPNIALLDSAPKLTSCSQMKQNRVSL